MKNLEKYGVQEMGFKEIKVIEGGLFDPVSFVISAIVGGIIYGCVKYVATHQMQRVGAGGYMGTKL